MGELISIDEAVRPPDVFIESLLKLYIMATNFKDPPQLWRLEAPIYHNLAKWLGIRTNYRQNVEQLPKQYRYTFLEVAVDPTDGRTMLVCERKNYPLSLLISDSIKRPSIKK